MKKLISAVMLLALCAPVFAGDKCEGDCPMKHRKEMRAAFAEKHPELKAKMEAKREEMKKERKAKKAAFKKNEEKVEKLVAEYKKLKPGKKQDAKRAEIAEVIAGFRAEQLNFKQEQLKEFQERLTKMQDQLAKESTDEAKTEWVNAKVEKVIADDGDLDAVFKPEHGRKGPGAKDGKHHGPKGHRPEMKK